MNRMLVFGGYDGTTYHNDLWQYTDAGGWRLLTADGAAGSPPARAGASAAWDSQQNRMLVFGGNDDGTYLNDLWQYSANGGWRLLTAQGDSSAPEPRWGAAAAWDSQSNRMLVFGGEEQDTVSSCDFTGGQTNQRNDLWQYTAAGGWQQVTGEDAVCAELFPRFFASTVWDSQANRLLMNGGWTGGILTLGDLWQYTVAGGWVNLVQFRSAPMPTRYGHTAVWDSQANRMLMFGGFQFESLSYNDLWQYTSSGWSLLTAEGAAGSPPGRDNHSAVWDSQANRMLVFGGEGSNHFFNDLWEYASPLPLTITTTSPLPSGTVGVPYSVTLQASGGTKPYTWSVAPDSLPPGLALDPSSGVISGIPTTAGTFSFTIQVQDSSSVTTTKQFSFAPPPQSGTADSGYSVPISITPPSSGGGGGGGGGGTPSPCTSYALAPGSGALPPGLTLDPSTGIISGTPTDGGSYTFTVQCANSSGETATQDFTITINNPLPALTSLSPSSVRAGGADFTLTVTGSGFVESSTVAWNGSSRATTYVSPTQLTAAVTAADVAGQGTADVTVVNGGPGGGTSNALPFTILSPNSPPTVSAGGPYTGAEGSAIALSSATASDSDGDRLTYTWSVAGTLPAGVKCTFSDSTALNPTVTCNDEGAYTVQLAVNDGVNPAVTSTATVNVSDVAPAVSITAPAMDQLIPVGSAGGMASVTATAPFTDAGTNDAHTCTVQWDTSQSPVAGTVSESVGSGTGTCGATNTALGPGVYTITVSVRDSDGTQAGTASTEIVVYDPSAGFVTGGGWITSPAGAVLANPTLTGKADFGFVARYQKGTTVPSGETEFQFQAGDLDFHSGTDTVLVISGNQAQYRGTGTINGAGTYSFVVTATDGGMNGGTSPDGFRITITDASGNVVYDNVPGASDGLGNTQALGGGSIVIHS